MDIEEAVEVIRNYGVPKYHVHFDEAVDVIIQAIMDGYEIKKPEEG